MSEEWDSLPEEIPSDACAMYEMERERRRAEHPGIQLVTVYVITYKTEQMDTRVGAVYFSLAAAREEMERLDNATSWGSAGIVIRQAQVFPQLLDMLKELP